MDLNADVGEGFGRWQVGDDEALLAAISSANVACGFHAGDPSLLRRTCELAAARGVVVGAQVSYPDLAGFGRRFLDMDADDLTNAVLYQIGALDGLARAAGTRVAYVKPHGALYNATVTHELQAAAVVAAVASYGSPDLIGESFAAQRRPGSPARGSPVRGSPVPGLPVLGLPGSALLRHAEQAGLRAVREFFADRAYAPDGTLLPRSQPGAVLTDPATVAARCARLLSTGEVVAVDGSIVRLVAESVCVHGDTPDATALAWAVRAAIEESGDTVRSFVVT